MKFRLVICGGPGWDNKGLIKSVLDYIGKNNIEQILIPMNQDGLILSHAACVACVEAGLCVSAFDYLNRQTITQDLPEGTSPCIISFDNESSMIIVDEIKRMAKSERVPFFTFAERHPSNQMYAG